MQNHKHQKRMQALKVRFRVWNVLRPALDFILYFHIVKRSSSQILYRSATGPYRQRGSADARRQMEALHVEVLF